MVLWWISKAGKCSLVDQYCVIARLWFGISTEQFMEYTICRFLKSIGVCSYVKYGCIEHSVLVFLSVVVEFCR